MGSSNLKSWGKGQSGNYGGRPKGTPSWSTIVRKLLADEELPRKVIARDSGLLRRFPNRNFGELIVAAMCVRAAGGDVAAAEWLRKTGYGDSKYIAESEPESNFLHTPLVVTIKSDNY